MGLLANGFLIDSAGPRWIGKRSKIKRHFEVVAEELRADIRALAEGHQALREELQEFRQEVRAEFQEVKAMIKFSYAELDRRIRALEHEVVDLRSRVERIEAAMGR